MDNLARAHELHNQGLAAELSGEYDRAYDLFWNVLSGVPANTHDLDVTMLRADAFRDLGFNDIRRVLSTLGSSRYVPIDTAFEDARRSLFAAEREAESYTSPGVIQNNIERQTVNANRGATISCLGRVATVAYALAERSDSHARAQAREAAIARLSYAQAHALLRQGNNGYYRTSNAIIATRQARLERDYLQMAVWFGRAVWALGMTAVKDHDNLTAARHTFNRRRAELHIGSNSRREQSLASVLSHP